MRYKISFILLYTLFYLHATDLDKQKMIKIITYENQNKAASREDKLKIINDINNEFKYIGYSKNDTRLINVILEIASEGTNIKVRDYNTLTNNYSILRKSAIKLLAKFGGESTRQGILHILDNENDQMVIAEICNTLSIIGDNKNGDAFHKVVQKYHVINNISPNLLLAIVNFTNAITINNGQMREIAIFFLQNIIQTYSYGDYGYVRRMAKETLKNIYSLTN